MPILSVNGLHKSFGGLTAVHDLSFDLPEGEILGVIGPNGSGKTTLFNMITGFVRPDRGEVRLNGNDLRGLRPHQVCRAGIARTFQLVKCFKGMTVLENVMVGRLYGKEPSSDTHAAQRESEELLQLAGLHPKRGLAVEQLGHADLRRLDTLMAVAARPSVLLLDEIMAGLNPAETEEAIRFVRHIQNSGISIVIVEHIVKAVLELSDRVMVINAGNKIAEGHPREIIHNEEVKRVYFGEE